MLGLLGGLPWRWIALALALAAAGASIVLWGNSREREGFKAGEASVMVRWQAADLARSKAAAKAEAAARVEEQRRAAAQQEVIDAYRAQAERARADAVIAAASAGRLQQRVAALLAAARDRDAAGNPPASAGSPAADDAADLLADVLGRCVERVRRLAEIADERGAAGQACERSYDALRAGTSTPEPAPTGAP